MKKDRYAQFTETSYGGRALLRKHSKGEHGVWEILGEDANAEFAGSHHQPSLAIVQGKLDDAIRYAVSLPRFWTWGGGGDIKRRTDITEALIKVPIVEENDAEAFKNQLLDSMDDHPEVLLPTAGQVRKRIEKEVAEQQALTYGMIAKIKKALETTDKSLITIKFTSYELKNRDKTLIKVLIHQGFKNVIVGTAIDQEVAVTFAVP